MRNSSRFENAVGLALLAFAITPGAATAQSADIEVRGKLEHFIGEDFKNQKAKHVFQIKDQHTGKAFEVRFSGKGHQRVVEGSEVILRGKANGRTLAVDEGEMGAAAGTSSSGSLQVTSAAVAGAVSGTQNVLVITVNFTDSNLTCTPSAVNNLVFGATNSVHSTYMETSFNSVGLTGQTVGPYNINVSSSVGCQYSDMVNIASLAEQAATSAGVNVSSFSRRIYVLPSISTCGSVVGWGSIGGSPSQSWVINNYCTYGEIYEHELGHNLGFNHSSTPGSEYGDNSDFMGIAGPGLRQSNGPHKVQLGWVSGSKVVQISGSGTFAVDPIERDPAAALNPLVMKLPKADTNETYFISYKQPIGMDALHVSSGYMTGVSIHRQSGNSNTFLLSTLSDGGVFEDTVNGIRIQQISHDSGSASFTVSTVCTPNAPSMSISQSSLTGAPGATVTYSATISNRDSSYCAPSTFNFTAGVPSGWSGSTSPTSVNLAPGASATVNLSVTSSLSAGDGTFPVSLSATDSGAAIHSASASANYVLDLLAPSVPTGLTATLATVKKSQQVTLSWNASSDSSGIASYVIYRNGVVLGTSTTTSYKDTSLAASSKYTYQVAAKDKAGNLSGLSAAVQITTAAASKGKPR